jgi:hypothetical protein
VVVDRRWAMCPAATPPFSFSFSVPPNEGLHVMAQPPCCSNKCSPVSHFEGNLHQYQNPQARWTTHSRRSQVVPHHSPKRHRITDGRKGKCG